MTTARSGLLAAPILSCLLVVFYLAPSAYTLVLAVAHGSTTFSSTWYLFQELFASERLLSSASRSVAAALPAALVSISVALFAAVGWLKSNRFGRRLLLGVLITPLFVPETGHALALSDLLVNAGVGKGIPATSFALLTYSFPFAGLVVLLRLASINDDIWRAAQDGGMIMGQMLRYVLLPLLWPAIVMGFLFSFLLSFNEFTRSNYCSAREMYSVYLAGVLNSGGAEAAYLFGFLALILGTSCFLVLARVMARA